MMKKLRYNYYNKLITTRDNSNVQSHDEKENKLSSAINVNSGAHTLTHDKIIKSPFNKNSVATLKSKLSSNKDLMTRPCQIGTMVLM